MDVASAVSAIGDAGTAIGTVGAAIVGVAAIAFAWRWIKASFF